MGSGVVLDSPIRLEARILQVFIRSLRDITSESAVYRDLSCMVVALLVLLVGSRLQDLAQVVMASRYLL